MIGWGVTLIKGLLFKIFLLLVHSLEMLFKKTTLYLDKNQDGVFFFLVFCGK